MKSLTLIPSVLLVLLGEEASAQWFPQFLGDHVTGTGFGIPGINAEFDYVIVGGGTAGSVVAARLIEETDATVAVIEGGTFYELANGNRSQIPQYSLEGASEDWLPAVDWGMIAEPDPGANDNQWLYAQGKCFGGSSGRNQMLYNRGTRGSYHLWAEEVGDDTFEWESMLGFYEKGVTHNAPDLSIRAPNSSFWYPAEVYQAYAEEHGSGPLQLSYPKYAQPMASYGAAAWDAIGLQPVQDLISGSLIGYTHFPFTIDPETQTRSSAETAFLSPAMRSSRLTVYMSSVASRVVFDDSKRATGVEISYPSAGYGSSPYTLRVRKEVIVSAGAMRSPQLLMLSGIGPTETLSELGIEIVSALEGVGQEMHDTCSIGGPTFKSTVDAAYAFTFTQEAYNTAQELFIANGTGPLGNEGSDFVAFTKLPPAYRVNFTDATNEAFAYYPSDWPELEISLTANAGGPDGWDEKVSYGSLSIQMVAVTSRGNVSINSTSIHNQPIIHTNFHDTEADKQMAIAAYRYLFDVAKNLRCKDGEAFLVGDPENTASTLADTELLGKYITENGVNPIHHATSTCRMGRDDDDSAVVDSKGRVFGVTALRVIDSSSFRHTTPGHTQGATYAHAEKLVVDVVMDGGYMR